LESNWVENTKVVYIGKATSLKSRLRQYFSFGQGKNIGHYGGRLIWQLKYSKDLVVCWESLPTDPREHEAELIRQFATIYGRRPFANLQN
ncbi:MAG: GIY-YIG nuclease family protein, partial [Clostridiales bacterium]